eukprot:Ihof_evm17s4 gene=Ihof_evmTU17s4
MFDYTESASDGWLDRIKLETLSDKKLHSLLKENNQDCDGRVEGRQLRKNVRDLINTLRYIPFGWSSRLLSSDYVETENLKENHTLYNHIPLLTHDNDLLDYCAERGFVLTHIVTHQYNKTLAVIVARKIGQLGVSSAILQCGNNNTAPICQGKGVAATALVIPSPLFPSPSNPNSGLTYYTTNLTVSGYKHQTDVGTEGEDMASSFMIWVTHHLPDSANSINNTRGIYPDIHLNNLTVPLVLHVSTLPRPLSVFSTLSWRYHPSSLQPMTLSYYNPLSTIPMELKRYIPPSKLHYKPHTLYIFVYTPFTQYRTMHYQGSMDISSLGLLLHLFYPTPLTVVAFLLSLIVVIYIIDISLTLPTYHSLAFLCALVISIQFFFILPTCFLVLAEFLFPGNKLPSLALWQLLACSNLIGSLVTSPTSFGILAGLLLIVYSMLLLLYSDAIHTMVVTESHDFNSYIPTGRRGIYFNNNSTQQRVLEELWEDQIDPYLNHIENRLDSPYDVGDWRSDVMEDIRDLPPHVF